MVLKEMAQLQPKGHILTVLAGVPIAYYQQFLGVEAPLVRVMPNLCSAVGEGMSVLTYGPHVSSDFKSLVRLLFASMGQVLELPEHLTDISCAIAGSGPGFIFRLINAAAKEGEAAGLSREAALKMSAQSFYGAAKLILSGKDPVDLQYQIAVPNGTTEAGFKVMDETHIDRHFRAVIAASAKRSEEISKSF
jgi:pyrroline-5-carboxylate reductase